MSVIDEMNCNTKKLEAEKEILEALKESGKFSIEGIEQSLTSDNLTDIDSRISKIESDLDKMIEASNVNLKTSFTTFAEAKE